MNEEVAPKPGHTTIQVSAQRLIDHNIRYAVVLENNEVKAFITTRSFWLEVEKSHEEDYSKWSDTNYKPLLSMNDDLKITIKELGWIQVGDV